MCLKKTGEMIGDCGLTLQNFHGDTNVPSIKKAESIGMHAVCEYPDETNGTTHVSAISREEGLNEIPDREIEGR